MAATAARVSGATNQSALMSVSATPATIDSDRDATRAKFRSVGGCLRGTPEGGVKCMARRRDAGNDGRNIDHAAVVTKMIRHSTVGAGEQVP